MLLYLRLLAGWLSRLFPYSVGQCIEHISDYFQKPKGSLSLAAVAVEEREITIAESLEQELTGILHYDYGRAALSLEIEKNTIGLKIVDFELVTNNDRHYIRQDVKIEDNRILLLSDTEYTEDKVREIILKPKS